MKKIRNIYDLHEEREMIEQRKKQLEKELHRDWDDLKLEISGKGNSFFVRMANKHGPGMMSTAISLGASLLAGKFGGKIGGKIYSWFK